MKLSVYFLVLVSVLVVAATPVAHKRQYHPEEELEHRQDFMIMPDDEGKVHFVDLTDRTEIRATNSDVTFYLYTRTNRNNPFVIPATNTAQVFADNSPFSASRKNFFISHGWNNNYQSDVNTLLTAAALDTQDVNVFVVDWSGPANKIYTTARSAVPSVGFIEGNFINFLMRSFSLTPDDFKLTGHSLGAHVAGCAGAAVNGQVSAIIGLDPASPLYSLGTTDNRIDPSDGQMVQIIHTNGGLLGFASSIGDTDFFPNGGSSQPGCGLDLVGSCAHSRAYIYYAESIRSSGFFSLQCDSYNAFNSGSCTTNTQSTLGEFVIDKSNIGDFFLNTNSQPPFARGSI